MVVGESALIGLDEAHAYDDVVHFVFVDGIFAAFVSKAPYVLSPTLKDPKPF